MDTVIQYNIWRNGSDTDNGFRVRSSGWTGIRTSRETEAAGILCRSIADRLLRAEVEQLERFVPL